MMHSGDHAVQNLKYSISAEHMEEKKKDPDLAAPDEAY